MASDGPAQHKVGLQQSNGRKLLAYIRMAFVNSGRIRHKNMSESLGHDFDGRTGYDRSICLRCLSTKYLNSKWPSIDVIPRRN